VVKILKYIDKFLKFLKTDRNTFFTYILTLISLYIFVDRIVEMLFLFFTGISVSYWGPIQYTLALACPVFAFLFSGSSSFVKSDKVKISFVYVYIITLYVIGISMVVQWLNSILWLLFMSVPNYVKIVVDSPELVRAAFTAISIYLPITTFFGVFRLIVTKIDDTPDLTDSILDYRGINLSDQKDGTGPYTSEITICMDTSKGKPVIVPENKRFESMLVVGGSGSGKTSMVFEPMIAKDISKKHFFKEVSKEMGFTALKTGLATLNAPYNNDYLNKNFNLSMLTPNPNKLKLYKAYMKKMLIEPSSDNITYKNVGITAMSPDYESTSHMIDVANNFNIPYNIIDPNDNSSIGMNPFIFDNPAQTAIAISSVLKGMYNTSHVDNEIAFRENVAAQAIENITILLKEMYPLLHDDGLPNLEDILNMLIDFNLVENMCRKLESNEKLSKKYKLLLAYFKKNFYSDGSGKADTERFIYSAVTQLDNLLRIQGVKNILCNRNNNIDFDKALSNGELTFVCTRRGDLGSSSHKAFGLFFILLMQYSVLRRPGNERNRVPHFFYIDEFPDFISQNTDSIFTLYRKYKVGTIISAQNLDQLGNKSNSKFRQTILSNCTTKMIFGNGTPEDNEWWTAELGNKRKWTYSNTYDTAKGSYDSKKGNIKWDWVKNFPLDKIRALGFKSLAYKTKNVRGGAVIGQGKVDFLESKYKEPKKTKKYNFSKFASGIIEEDNEQQQKKNKFDYRNVNFDKIGSSGDIDPIKTNTTDSNFIFDNDDAIIVDLKKRNTKS